MWWAIVCRFDLDNTQLPAEVKEADNRILLTERDALMPNTRYSWEVDDLEPLPVEVQGWAPDVAERRYLDALCPTRRVVGGHDMRPLRERLGPGAARRRLKKIARRREDLDKAPQPPQEPRDRVHEQKTAARIRKRRAEAVRRRHDDPVEAARAIRMLGLPRIVKPPAKAPAKRRTRKKVAA
ncbi:MAG TPA: hypothetical protein VEW95_09280 [Candidatus Limnocylindrales bacterium]|nr:hypothetical protein [Candidatus Limnocylindrales bacterium]